jgi:sensor histidine kinase regulating citrate/malate metabolism
VALGELSAAQRVKVDHSVELVLVDGERMRAVDVEAPVAGGALGVVHVGLSRDVIDAQVVALRRSMLGLALLILAGGASVALLFGRRVARPLRELSGATARQEAEGALRPRRTPARTARGG